LSRSAGAGGGELDTVGSGALSLFFDIVSEASDKPGDAEDFTSGTGAGGGEGGMLSSA